MANLSQLCTFSPSLSQLHPRSVAHASGGGAPCLTAGDARAVARVNPWGGVQRGLRRRRRRTASVERVTKVDVVRHLRCRRLPSPLLHFSTGSPFGHHPRLSMVCPLRGQWGQAGRFLFSLPLHFSTLHFSTSPLSTGSPFGHHPRLSMVCPRWGQWVDNELFLLLPRKTNSGEECVFS